MTLQEFGALMAQMKQTSVPFRLVFIWPGSTKGLNSVLEGIEITRYDMTDAQSNEVQHSESIQRLLEIYLSNTCKTYRNGRNEPSVLVIDNAILLSRYCCDLSPIFKHGISPRSAVILIFPKESQKQLPARTGAWVTKDTWNILLQTARQIGEPGCIIDV